MCEMERPCPKPRNRQPNKNKTSGVEAPVQTNFTALDLQNDLPSLETHLQDTNFPDNPAAARRRFTSQLNEFEQWSSNMPRRIKHKQAVTNDGQVFNIAVSEDAECDMEESPVRLRGVKVMFPDNNHAARRRLASQLEQCRSINKSPVKLPGVKVLLPRKHY